MTRAPETPTRELLLGAALAALTCVASLAQGCHESRSRPAVLPPPHVAPIGPPAAPAPPPRPAEEIGGFLAQEHVELVGIGAYPHEEPWAPPGEWVSVRAAQGGTAHVWVPRFVPRSYLAALIAEVETTLPRHDRLYGADPSWVGLPLGARLVILPGAFQLRTDTGLWELAAGLTAMDSWHEPAAVDRDADVIYVGWRPQASGPYLPALAHELAHSWSRSWLGEGPPGTREVGR